MDAQLFEALLHEAEGATLDFKRDQYPFINATPDQKSELLKDIMAFANALRSSEAYILIGVEEVKGGRSVPRGIASDLDDASLQEFVNKKTYRPILFSYETCEFDGIRIGVIRIERQERPFCLKEDFGKLKRNAVYMRRGSSTVEVPAHEVYDWGKRDELNKTKEPVLNLGFADITEKAEPRDTITIRSIPVTRLDESRIPDYRGDENVKVSPGRIRSYAFYNTNTRFYKDLNNYISATSVYKPVGFAISNLSAYPALDVRMELSVPKVEGLLLVDASKFPKQPKKCDDRSFVNDVANEQLEFSHLPSGVEVEGRPKEYILHVRFKKIQPKATAWSTGMFYVGSTRTCSIECSARVYADNLSAPLIVPLTLELERSSGMDITIQILKSHAEKFS